MAAITQHVEPETVIKRQRAEIARLTAELDAARAVMKGYAVSSSVIAAELAASKERERVLREAAAPLVHFINRWEATPLRGLSEEFYSIHGGIADKEAILRISDFRALRAALGEP